MCAPQNGRLETCFNLLRDDWDRYDPGMPRMFFRRKIDDKLSISEYIRCMIKM